MILDTRLILEEHLKRVLNKNSKTFDLLCKQQTILPRAAFFLMCNPVDNYMVKVNNRNTRARNNRNNRNTKSSAISQI